MSIGSLWLNGAPPAAGTEADANPLRFGGYGLWVYNHRDYPLQTGGNVYLAGARAYFKENGALTLPLVGTPQTQVVEEGDGVYLQLNFGAGMGKAATKLVDTELLGKAKIPGLAYEDGDGSRLVIDSDYSARKRKISYSPLRRTLRGVRVRGA